MDASPSDEYLSCEWIEGGIAFNRRSIHACLIVHHDTGLPFIAPYKGGTVPLQLMMDERDRIRAANQDGGHPACVGCPNLRRQRWQRSEQPIRMAGIAHYSHCNIKCGYCFLQRQDRESFVAGFQPYALLPSMQELIDSGLLAHDAIVDWGGGEPTTYNEIDSLLDLLLEHGTFHYLHTNGTVLPSAIRRTPHPERVHVICSVDSGTAETYFQIKQRDLFEQVWNNLRQYVEIGVHVTPKYIMLPENCDEENLTRFIERVVEIGASDVILDVDYNVSQPGDEIIDAVARLKMLSLHAGLQVQFGFTGANFAPENRVVERLEAAFAREQLSSIANLLAGRGYALHAALNMTVSARIQMLESHTAAKEREIISKEAEIAAKELAVVALTSAIVTKEATLQRAIATSAEQDIELVAKEREIAAKELALVALTSEMVAKEAALQHALAASHAQELTILDLLGRLRQRDAVLCERRGVRGSIRALWHAVRSSLDVEASRTPWTRPNVDLRLDNSGRELDGISQVR